MSEATRTTEGERQGGTAENFPFKKHISRDASQPGCWQAPQGRPETQSHGTMTNEIPSAFLFLSFLFEFYPTLSGSISAPINEAFGRVEGRFLATLCELITLCLNRILTYDSTHLALGC